MAIFRSILFPVDFSERCRFAAPFVRMMAEQCRADLTVMHVIELPVSVYSTIGHEITLDLPAMRRAAREQLETFVRAELAGIKLRSAVEEGRAASSIAHFADEHGIDLFDSSLVNEEFIAFNAGTHRDLVHMSVKDFLRLVQPAIGDFALHVESSARR